jgi:hypothetical protein
VAHAKLDESPVDPAALLTLPLPGTERFGTQLFAPHVGVDELYEPAAVHDVDVAPLSV